MWLSNNQAYSLVAQNGSPLFIYSAAELTKRATVLTQLVLPFGHTVRFAIKANPHPEIIRLLAEQGLQFDASSSYEVAGLLEQGIVGEHISLSSQQPAHNLPELLAAGVQYVATSMHQLRLYAAVAGHSSQVGLRVNPVVGSGHNNRTTTGGTNSSFGLWHEYVNEALAFAREHDIHITRLHVHIGSGADPSTWGETMDKALALIRCMPEVMVLDIGGGYKIARVTGEQEADMVAIGELFATKLRMFATETGRQIHLELEPGTWLVGHIGILLAEVVDIVDTGLGGHTFLRLNTGMNDIIRPSMYGAQHSITLMNDATEQVDYVVVGHNCETGDILTPAPGDPEHLAPRQMNRAHIGDSIAIADTGAYCASFSTTGYNSYPSAKEVVVY